MKTLLLFSLIFFTNILQAQNNSSSKIMMNKGVPNSVVKLGSLNIVDGFVTSNQLASVDTIFAEMINSSGVQRTVPVSEYALVYQPKKGNASVRNIKQSAITPEIKRIFQNSHIGDKMIVFNVRVKKADGININIGLPFQLEVK